MDWSHSVHLSPILLSSVKMAFWPLKYRIWICSALCGMGPYSNCGKYTTLGNDSIWSIWEWSYETQNNWSGEAISAIKYWKCIFSCLNLWNKIYLFQLYTIGCILSMIVGNLMLINILGIFVMSNSQLHPFLIVTYKFGLMATSSYFSLTVIEVAILRFLTVFVWKRVPPIEDQFTVIFLTLVNILFCVLIGTSRFQTGEGVEYDARFLGADPLLIPEPNLKIK